MEFFAVRAHQLFTLPSCLTFHFQTCNPSLSYHSPLVLLKSICWTPSETQDTHRDEWGIDPLSVTSLHLTPTFKLMLFTTEPHALWSQVDVHSPVKHPHLLLVWAGRRENCRKLLLQDIRLRKRTSFRLPEEFIHLKDCLAVPRRPGSLRLCLERWCVTNFITVQVHPHSHQDSYARLSDSLTLRIRVPSCPEHPCTSLKNLKEAANLWSLCNGLYELFKYYLSAVPL